MRLGGERVAVTGASGFVGSHLALALAQAGAEVTGVVRSPGRARWLTERGVALQQADLADAPALERAFQGATAVVANAALGSNQGSLEELVRVNTTGVRHTLMAAARAGITRVVYISSVAVYKNRPGVWLKEDAEQVDTHVTSPWRRRWVVSDLTTDWRYSLSKARAEQLAFSEAERLGIELTSLRPGPVYGSRDPKLTARLRRRLRLPLVVVPSVGVPLVHAGDVALAAVSALTRPHTAREAYHLAAPPVPLSEVYRTLVRVAGGGPRVVTLPVPLWVGFDTHKAERELGFAPRSLEEGLREALSEG